MMRDNIRAPDMVVGDMEAQVAASRIGAERYLELIERHGLETRGGGGRCAHGPLRAPDAPGDRGAARRHLPGRRACGRLPRRPRPAPFQGRRGRHRQGQRAGGRPGRHCAPVRRPAHQHAARRHGRLRDLADGPLDPARQRDLRPHSAELGPDPPHHHQGAGGHDRESHLSGADHRALRLRQHRRRYADEGAGPGGAGQGLRRRRQPQGHRVLRHQGRRPLGPHGHP